MKFRFKDLVAFNLDGGAGGGGSGGGAGGSGGGQQPSGGGGPESLAAAAARIEAPAGGGQGQQQNQQQPGGQQQQQPNPGQQQTPQAYYPENLPDTFRGTNDRETIDKLYGEISGRPKPPATAKDYKYEFAEDFTKKFGDLKDDPVLPMWSELAHELGLSNQQAQDVVPKLFEKLTKAGIIPEPVDTKAEMAKLEPNEKDPVRQQAKAAARVNALARTLQGLETRGILNKADMLRTSIVLLDAANVSAFEKIFKLLPAEHGLQGGGGNPVGGYGWEDADKEMADERYSSTSPKFDPKFRSSVDDKMRQLPKRGGYFLNGRPA